MDAKQKLKEDKRKPDQVLLEKYEDKLAFWQHESQKAFEKHDWSARNWANSQILIIKNQIIDIKNKLGGIHNGFINAECV